MCINTMPAFFQQFLVWIGRELLFPVAVQTAENRFANAFLLMAGEADRGGFANGLPCFHIIKQEGAVHGILAFKVLCFLAKGHDRILAVWSWHDVVVFARQRSDLIQNLQGLGIDQVTAVSAGLEDVFAVL